MKHKKYYIFVIRGFITGFIFSSILFYIFFNILSEKNDAEIEYFKSKPYLLEDFDYKLVSVENNTDDNILNGIATKKIVLKEDDNIFSALLNYKFNVKEIREIINLLRETVDFTGLYIGQVFTIEYNFNEKILPIEENLHKQMNPPMFTKTEVRNIRSLTFKDRSGNKILISRKSLEDPFKIKIEPMILTKRIYKRSGTINTNLFTDVLDADVSVKTLYTVLNEFAFIIDFQRDIQKGDKFEFVIESVVDEEGSVKNERIIYAKLLLRKQKYELFKFNNEFYDRDGNSVKKSLLKSPVDGARISSGYSKSRKHPILGYKRAHLGIDFAVPNGTQIYAAGDGTIVEKAENNGLGNFIKIKHLNGYETVYGHMSRFGKYRTGDKVKQKNVIGYVGSTGMATGPHLHYEVKLNGSHINPSNLKSIATTFISKKDKKEFIEIIEKIDNILLEK